MKTLALALLMIACGPHSQAWAQRYVISIGANVGDPGEEELRWAHDDARRTHAMLLELGDVRAQDALLLLGATADDTRRALRELSAKVAQAKSEGRVVFAYYSGHGDAQSLHLNGSRLPLSELQHLLEGLGANTLVTIVDACRDQPAGIRDKGARHLAPFDIRLEHNAAPLGRVTITSSGRNEVAQESDLLRGSFFTHHLLSGMRGAADRDGDRQVSLDELYRYAYHHTLSSSHAQLAAVQHPQLDVALQGEGELVITRLSHAQAALDLPAALSGDVMIIDDRSSQVVAQMWKPVGVNGRVAVGAGRFRVQVRQGVDVYAGEVGLEWGGIKTLELSALQHRGLEGSQTKGYHPPRFDPQAGVLAIGGKIGAATIASGLLLGGGARAAWQLSGARLIADLQLGAAQGQNPILRHDYLETRLGFGAGPQLALGPFDVFAGASAGLLWIHERATRTVRDDAVAALGVQRTHTNNALGPYAAPSLALEAPFGNAYVLTALFELQLALLPVNGALRWSAAPMGSLMLGRRF